MDVFGKHWQDESWHEVLRLIVGMMIDVKFAGEIIDYLMALNGEAKDFINLFLAADCLGEIRNRTVIAATSATLIDRLKALTCSYDPAVDGAVSRIATIWQDDPTTLPWLKNLARSDADEFIRLDALEELVKGWKYDSEILLILKNFVLSDETTDDEVRRIAIELLVKGWKDDPNTLPWLKELIRSNVDEFIKSQAIYQLVYGWKDEPDVFLLLKNIAQSNVDPYLRLVAVDELAEGWRDNPDMPNFLGDRAVDERFDVIKHKYLWVMNPRQAALAAITRQYSDHPKTLPLLRNRAENDPDYEVRKFAVQELVKG